jgi:hypothetical protein
MPEGSCNREFAGGLLADRGRPFGICYPKEGLLIERAQTDDVIMLPDDFWVSGGGRRDMKDNTKEKWTITEDHRKDLGWLGVKLQGIAAFMIAVDQKELSNYEVLMRDIGNIVHGVGIKLAEIETASIQETNQLKDCEAGN